MELINKIINRIKKISGKTWVIIALVMIFLMMLVLNFLTPLIADDYAYSFIHGTEDRVKNVLDVFVSQAHHYMTWGGRSVAHFIAQIFLMMPKGVFSVCNSAVYTLVVYLIYKITCDKERPLLLVLIHFLLYFCLPVFGQNCIWLIGSCNYLWTTMFILIFLLLLKKQRKDSILNIILIFLMGVLAGWSNENSGFALIVITFLTILITKKGKLEKWKLSGLFGTICGFLIMILAPGNYARNSGIVEEASFIMKIITRGITYSNNLIRFMLPLLILSIVLVTLTIYEKKKINKLSFAYFAGSFFAVYSMLLSPQFPERSWISPVLFMIMGDIILINELHDVRRIYKFILADVIIVFSIFYIRSYVALAKDINRLRTTWNYRISEINKIKNKEDSNIEFYAFSTENWKNPNCGLVDLTEEVDEWPDRDIAVYYGIDSIKSKIDE